MMPGLSSYSASSHALTEPDPVSLGASELDADSHRYILALPETEAWHKHRLTTRSCTLLEPETLSATLVSRTASCDALYELRTRDAETEFPFEGSSMLEGLSGDYPVSPHTMKRRRGGLIEQRDIIKAHEAHKMQSTPQARRKEWE
ncbi:hypothetical protein NDU88_003841 [Pleurodeles waltl]|uniref:Uncharacterized protein n=1 Tax=Pleurodeles waltl TaxID=8319 RepID=A0AAV7T7F1_PLEWA|nr:hypothetical protein NDU88_003841 [Pleurodeles waltl]